MRKLSACAQGDDVTILRVQGDQAFRLRLMEMGFAKGARLKIIKYAPLKDPMEVEIKGYRLSLRVREADDVAVTVNHNQPH
jgi:Fe2+ transport system protein FeoA